MGAAKRGPTFHSCFGKAVPEAPTIDRLAGAPCQGLRSYPRTPAGAAQYSAPNDSPSALTIYLRRALARFFSPVGHNDGQIRLIFSSKFYDAAIDCLRRRRDEHQTAAVVFDLMDELITDRFRRVRMGANAAVSRLRARQMTHRACVMQTCEENHSRQGNPDPEPQHTQDARAKARNKQRSDRHLCHADKHTRALLQYAIGVHPEVDQSQVDGLYSARPRSPHPRCRPLHIPRMFTRHAGRRRPTPILQIHDATAKSLCNSRNHFRVLRLRSLDGGTGQTQA